MISHVDMLKLKCKLTVVADSFLLGNWAILGVVALLTAVLERS